MCCPLTILADIKVELFSRCRLKGCSLVLKCVAPSKYALTFPRHFCCRADTKSPRLYTLDLRSGEDRELDQLSDGTRAQLLLAARIAFAEEVERGTTLPLFLDEALDQSDTARFEAIARSLGRIANDQGRQIFYLTSDPLDRERIRQALDSENCVMAAEIDLGSIRGRGARVTEPTALQVPPRPLVPAPDGRL